MFVYIVSNSIYNNVLNYRSDHDIRFDGNIPSWNFMERLGASPFSRIRWGTLYTFFYIAFVPASD